MPKYRHGDGCVYLRGKTYWYAFYVNGERVARSAKTKDKATARKILAIERGKAEEGKSTLGEDRISFQDLSSLLVTDYRVNELRSLEAVERRIRLHLEPFFGAMRARAIDAGVVAEYIAHRKDEGAENGTINRELAALKRMFSLAVRAGKLYQRPHIETLRENNVRTGFFEQGEFERVRDELPEYLRAPITFAYLTGWRTRSEVLRLAWDRVDFSEGTVRLAPGSTKNGEGRIVFMSSELRELLSELDALRKAAATPCPLVFHRNGNPIVSPNKAWRSACKRAGVDHRIIHDLRRTAVRNMVAANVPERVVMALTGHKTRSVLDRYNIVAPSDLKEAAAKLDRAKAAQTATKFATVTPSEAA